MSDTVTIPDASETAQHRMAWALWHEAGLSLAQLRHRFPHLPWEAVLPEEEAAPQDNGC